MDLQQFFLDLGLPSPLVVIIVATLPVVELRGAITLVTNVLDMHWAGAFLLAINGDMLPIPFILHFLNGLTCNLGRYHFFERLFDWLFSRTRVRSGVILKHTKSWGWRSWLQSRCHLRAPGQAR